MSPFLKSMLAMVGIPCLTLYLAAKVCTESSYSYWWAVLATILAYVGTMVWEVRQAEKTDE